MRYTHDPAPNESTVNRIVRSIASLSAIALLPLCQPSAREASASPAGPPALVSQIPRFGAVGATAGIAGFATQPRGVLVVGGTPAGVAAALAAARHGADVTLVADSPHLGGVLTDAMMDQWDFNLAPGGAPIEGGIFAEMFARLGDAFSPDDAARTFDAMIAAEPRVRVVRDVAPVAVRTVDSPTGRRVASVTVRDARTGRALTLDADVVVDATDAANVAASAGARFDIGRQDTGIDERTQAVTLMFALRGVDWATIVRTYEPIWYGPGGVTERRAWGYSEFAEAYRPLDPMTLVRDLNFGRLRDGSVTVNAVDLCGVNGLSAADRSRAARLARREAVALVAYLRTHLPGFERARIVRYARQLYVRETRHIAGLARLTTTDIWQERVPADAIGLSSYPIDLHAVLPSQPPAFAPVRHVYGIPFGALVPRGLANLVLASPAISATHLASGSARVVPTTVEEGEAGGVAAATAVREGTDIRSIALSATRIEALRATLASGGTILARPGPSVVPRAAPALFAAVRNRHRG